MSRDRKDRELELQEHGRDLLDALRLQMEIDFIEAQVIQQESYAQWLKTREALAKARDSYPN